MIQSMTAYASRSGARGTQTWAWDLRSVNARGLDLRLRLPEGIDGLEAAVRAALTARLTRGSVTLSLRLSREGGEGGIAVDPQQLDRALAALSRVEAAAASAGLTLRPASAAEVLSLRGVLLQTASDTVEDSLLNDLTVDLDALLEEFLAMRRAEGRALAAILGDLIGQIESLVAEAARLADARKDEAREALRTALRRVFEDIPDIDEPRLTQELALIAVKSDVAEEIARLTAHAAAARDLLADGKPAGRKLDFLAQEFNREANTLCSKAQSAALTRVGLDLKAVIDQMREQVQNVE